MSDATIVVVPLGAHEQHGPHLPLETDTLIADGICRRLAAALGAERDVRFWPVEPVGYSPEHMEFVGSQTLTWAEAIERWTAIGAACAGRGVRRIVFMNAHGGNVPLVQVVCQELRAQHKMLAVATKWDRFVKASGIVSPDEAAFGVHGGQIETAVMLALHPDLVDMVKAGDFDNLQARLGGKHLRAYGAHSFGWMAQDLNGSGVTGNAAAARAATGEALLEGAVAGLVELLDDVARFDLALLSNRPSTCSRGNAPCKGWKNKIDIWFWMPKLVNSILLLAVWRFNDLFERTPKALALASGISVEPTYLAAYLIAVLGALASMTAVARLVLRQISARKALVSLLIQTVLLIGIFAAIYAGHGLMHEPEPDADVALYFSLVTWTTLGYGDFHPIDALQLVAAIEAVLGYLFLGLVVGVAAASVLQKESG